MTLAKNGFDRIKKAREKRIDEYSKNITRK